MEQSSTALERMLRHALVAVVRLDHEEAIDAVVEAIAAGGITTVEITLTTPGALDALARWSARPELLVGAGSVMSTEDVARAVDHGALFIASPVCDEAVVATTTAAGCVAMPGAMTPTEIVRARSVGADIVKVFPMPADGAGYIRAIRGPLPSVRLAPSGGVRADTAASLLRAGADALNVGSWLTHEPDGSISPLAAITERATALCVAAARYRSAPNAS